VRVEAEERVRRVVRRRVRSPRRGGERQRLEPRGAALGRAREHHVAPARREQPALHGHYPRHPRRQHPGALVAAQPQLGVARQRRGQALVLLHSGILLLGVRVGVDAATGVVEWQRHWPDTVGRVVGARRHGT